MSNLAFFISTTVPQAHPDPALGDFRVAFLKAINVAYKEAESAPGFIAHANQIAWVDSKSEFDQDYGAWGRYEAPRYFQGSRELGRRELSQSLSLWRDLESVYAYAYDNTHGHVMKRSRSHFKLEFYAVAYWLEEGTVPTWQNAVERLHHLYDHGPSPQGFNAKHPYDSLGRETRLNPQKLRALRRHADVAELEI